MGIGPAAAEPIAEVSIEPHAAELRGLELVLESPTSEGRFGYMFKNQPPHAASEDLLSALGQTMEGTAGHRHQPRRPGDGRAGSEERRQSRGGDQGP